MKAGGFKFDIGGQGEEDSSQPLKNTRWKGNSVKKIQCNSPGFILFHGSQSTQPYTITGF